MSKSFTLRPRHSQSSPMESRVMPGPGEQPFLAEHAVDERRLPGVGPADDRNAQRPSGSSPWEPVLVVILVDRGW